MYVKWLINCHHLLNTSFMIVVVPNALQLLFLTLIVILKKQMSPFHRWGNWGQISGWCGNPRERQYSEDWVFTEHITNSCHSYRCLFEARDLLLLSYGFQYLFQLYCIKIVGTSQCLTFFPFSAPFYKIISLWCLWYH